MTLLQKQEYDVWFEYLANKAMELKDGEVDLKSADISNILKSVSSIGIYVVSLEKENLIVKKQVSNLRGRCLELETNNKTIKTY